MSTIPALTTVLAGLPVNVELHGGLKLAVFVRQMPARHLMTKFMQLIDHEAEMLEAICQPVAGDPPLPADWVDALTPESHALLVRTAIDLNFQLAVAQAERMAATREKLQPLEARANSLRNSSLTPP